MTKAEVKALEKYPIEDGKMWTSAFGTFEFDRNYPERKAFQEGYEQAEKDLALTWEDAQLLHIITEKYLRELDKRIEAFPSSSQEVFEEILRKYKEAKK